MNRIPRRENSGKGVERLEMRFGGKKYDTQFTRTGNNRKIFMHDNEGTGSRQPHNITIKSITAGNKPDKRKTERKTKREGV